MRGLADPGDFATRPRGRRAFLRLSLLPALALALTACGAVPMALPTRTPRIDWEPLGVTASVAPTPMASVPPTSTTGALGTPIPTSGGGRSTIVAATPGPAGRWNGLPVPAGAQLIATLAPGSVVFAVSWDGPALLAWLEREWRASGLIANGSRPVEYRVVFLYSYRDDPRHSVNYSVQQVGANLCWLSLVDSSPP